MINKDCLIKAVGCYATGDCALADNVLTAAENLKLNLIHFGAGEDVLQHLIRKAHPRGIKVFLYTFGLEFRKVMLENERNWSQQYSQGDINKHPCPNNLEFRNQAIKAMQELFGRVDLDGFFYDGPVFTPGTCYCKWCRARFEKEVGMPIPVVQNEEDIVWKQFKSFRYQWIAEWIKILREGIKQVNPEIELYTNTTGGIHRLWYLSGRDPALNGEVQDIEGSEMFNYYHTREQGHNRPLWALSACAKINRQAVDEKKPTVVFTTSIPRPGGGASLPSAQLENLIYQAIAQGTGIWLEQFPGGDASEAVKRAFEFIDRQSKHINKVSSCAPIALAFSRQCGDFYAVDPAENSDWTTAREQGGKEGKKVYLSSFHGAGELLLRSQMPYDIILDKHLQYRQLMKYALIVLENTPCLSDAQCEELKEYVRNGGTLMAAYETSLYNEWGEKRKDFGLAEVFGVSLDPQAKMKILDRDWNTGKLLQEKEIVIQENQRIVDRLGWTVEFKEDLLPRHPHYLTPYALIGLKLSNQAKLLASWKTLNQEPALVLNEFGKGKAIYSSGSIGAEYYIRQFNETKELFRDIVKILIANKLPFELEASVDTMETSLMKKGESYIIHLVNYTSNGDRPITVIFPVDNVKITMKDKCLTQFKKAKLLMAQKEVEVENNTIVIPRLECYEGVVLFK